MWANHVQVYVMGPITILVRRPSLRLPVSTSDLEEEVGSIQAVGRVSAYHSESEFGSAPQGDPPHWAIQALAQALRKAYHLTLFNFDLIQPDSSQDYGEHMDFDRSSSPSKLPCNDAVAILHPLESSLLIWPSDYFDPNNMKCFRQFCG